MAQIVETIDPSQIHLWLAWLGELTSARRLDEYRRLLSEEEREKRARFYFERDRHRYLVTRAMVRTVLAKYTHVEARDWRFAINPYGRPSIAPGLALARRIEFNVSHTDGLVVMAVACERTIGVDVENVRVRKADIGGAERYFAEAEVAALRALPRERQQDRFFQYWTLKESYIKARGLGLSIPLDRFAFDLDDVTGIRLTIAPSLGDSPGRWRFWQLQLGHEHLAALCAETVAHGWPEVTSARRWS